MLVRTRVLALGTVFVLGIGAMLVFSAAPAEAKNGDAGFTVNAAWDFEVLSSKVLDSLHDRIASRIASGHDITLEDFLVPAGPKGRQVLPEQIVFQASGGARDAFKGATIVPGMSLSSYQKAYSDTSGLDLVADATRVHGEGITVAFRDLDVSGMTISGFDGDQSTAGGAVEHGGPRIARLELKGCLADNANLTDTNVGTLEIIDTSFSGALAAPNSEILNVNIEKSLLRDTSLQGLDLTNTELAGSHLDNVDIAGSKISTTTFRESTLTNMDLSGLEFKDPSLAYWGLQNANLANVTLPDQLTGGSFSGATLQDVKVKPGSRIDLRVLKGATLQGSIDLTGANVTGDLGALSLDAGTRIVLEGARLQDVTFGNDITQDQLQMNDQTVITSQASVPAWVQETGAQVNPTAAGTDSTKDPDAEEDVAVAGGVAPQAPAAPSPGPMTTDQMARIGTGKYLVGSGHAGDDVARIQTQLNAQGADISVDGVVGPDTTAAVRDFQEEHALRVDGLVGAQTASVLWPEPATDQ